MAGFLLLFSFGVFGHPFYVSICQIDHNPDSSSLEITFKFFTDDLETVLEAKSEKKLRLGTENESENADRDISAYIQQKFKIEVNGELLDFSFLGKEVEFESTWCYMEVSGVKGVKEIRITNAVFIEQFESQTNLVHIKIGEQKKSMLLHKDKVTDTVSF